VIRFSCPACKKVLKVTHDGAGRHTACPRCGQRLVVPSRVMPHGEPVIGRIVSDAEPAVTDPTDQVNVQCPVCAATFLLPQSAMGFWATCPKCGGGFAASTEEDDAPEPARRWPRLRWPARSFLIGLVMVSVLAVAVYLVYSGRSSPLRTVFGTPSTCKELVERLQASGLDIRWCGKTFRYPAIYIVSKGSSADNSMNLLDFPNRPWFEGEVVVIQFPSTQEAEEKAGTLHNAFSYDRFLIYGDADLVKEIKRRL
jgi:ribosomal protein L37AE/L43A